MTEEEDKRDKEMEQATTDILDVIFELKPDRLEINALIESMEDEAGL